MLHTHVSSVHHSRADHKHRILTQSMGFPELIPVHVNRGFVSALALARPHAPRRRSRTWSNWGSPRMPGPQPKSLIMKRRTPTASAASVMAAWWPIPAGPTTHTTASLPARASLRGSRVYSTRLTGMPGGKVAEDSSREMIDSWKPAADRAAVMGVPKLPEAWWMGA
jgi:hypothetical protein